MLGALPQADIDEMKADGRSVITCEVGSTRDVFTPAELDGARLRGG